MIPFETQFDHALDVELPLKSQDFARLTENNENDHTTVLRLSSSKVHLPLTDLGPYLEYLGVPFLYAPSDDAVFAPVLDGNFFLPKNHKTYAALTARPEDFRGLIQHFTSYLETQGPPAPAPIPLSAFSFLRFEAYLYEHMLDAFLEPPVPAPQISASTFQRLRTYLEHTESPLYELLRRRWGT